MTPGQGEVKASAEQEARPGNAGGPQEPANETPAVIAFRAGDDRLQSFDDLQASISPITLRFPQADGEGSQREAFRIQVAVVAAQQAALLDWEWRLQQRQEALHKQQEQLSAHLENKHRRTLEMTRELQATRAALLREKEELARQAAKGRNELEQAKAPQQEEQLRLQSARAKLLVFRRRLKKHADQQLAAERTKIRNRESAVAEQHRRLEREAEKLQMERDKLVRARLDFNGEMELAKRVAQADQHELAQQRLAWQIERDRQLKELADKADTLKLRETLLVEQNRNLEKEKQTLERRRKVAEQELHGLEKRIKNQRRRLKVDSGQWTVDSEKSLPCFESTSGADEKVEDGRLAPVVFPFPSKESPNRLDLERAAGEVADQRLELVEHWQRIAFVQQVWRQAQQQVVNEMDEAGNRLDQREADLAAKEAKARNVETELTKRAQELSELRQHLEAWASRVRSRETNWEAEKDVLLTKMRTQTEYVEKQLTAIAELRRQWNHRRDQELTALKAEYENCKRLRRQCAAIRQECCKKQLSLDQQQRDLADRALALEEYRQQFVMRSPDAAVAEQRLNRLQSRWQRESDAAMRTIQELSHKLQAELADMDQRGMALLKAAEGLVAREAALTKQSTAWEESLRLAESRQLDLQRELQQSRNHNASLDRQLAEAQSEVERLARILMDPSEKVCGPSAEAA